MLKRFLKKGCIKNNQGFSLVELIVVIAIMAVMAAVLAPALLGYVEKSRMQKDDSAMDEVVNAMQLSLADQAIYDEVLEHSVWDNVSCYIDQKEESKFVSHKVTLKAEHGDKKEQYMFGDEARLLDETVYYAAGNMRGLTITFSPSESGDTYDFANGILNKFVGRKTGLLSENPELYNRLRSVIGDKLDTTSQTYRNSDYTIFIRVGSTGGSEAVMQDAIQVWGQFNGTNLAERDHRYEISAGRIVGEDGKNDVVNNQNNNAGGFDFSENPVKTMDIWFVGIGKTVKIQYRKNMTWGEWFSSEFNETDWYLMEGLSGRQYIVTNEICACDECSRNSSSDGVKTCNKMLTVCCDIPNIDINVPESLTYSGAWINTNMLIERPITGYNEQRFEHDYLDFLGYNVMCSKRSSSGILLYNVKNDLIE